MQMVEHYAKQVNQKKLATSAILKSGERNMTDIVHKAFDLVRRGPPATAKCLRKLVGDVGFEPTTR